MEEYTSASVAIRKLLPQALLPRVALATYPRELNSVPPLNSFIVFGEPEYPKALSDCPDAPPVLFYKGDLALLSNSQQRLSIVGTRKSSSYGEKVAAQFAWECSRNNIVTVSGLAFGIDTVVHTETINNGGKTIAVMGTDINTPYPALNRGLYERIVKTGGLILSESHIKQPYGQWFFPKRNRIIAGLSQATLVIEAPESSGALNTATCAFGYSREVYSVPARIYDDNSRGCLELYSGKKAEPAVRLSDIFPKIATYMEPMFNLSKLNELQARLLKEVGSGITSEGMLTSTLKISAEKLAVNLCMLELYGYITRNQDGKYVATR